MFGLTRKTAGASNTPLPEAITAAQKASHIIWVMVKRGVGRNQREAIAGRECGVHLTRRRPLAGARERQAQ